MSDVNYLVVPDDDDFDAGYVSLPEEEEDVDLDGHPDIPEDLGDSE